MVNTILASIEKVISGSIQGILKVINGAIEGLNNLIAPVRDLLKEKAGITIGEFKTVSVGSDVNLGRVGRVDMGKAMNAIQAGALGGRQDRSFAMGEGISIEEFLARMATGGATGTGGSGSGGSAKQQVDNALKEAERLAEEEKRVAERALKQIEDARIDAIENEDKRRIEKIKLNAQRELEAFKGTEEQKAEFKRLLDTRVRREVDAINQAKNEKDLKEAERLAKERAAIEKQQLAENIIFQNVRDVDDALLRLEQFAESGLSGKLLNYSLGS
jgi:hypothetical protein